MDLTGSVRHSGLGEHCSRRDVALPWAQVKQPARSSVAPVQRRPHERLGPHAKARGLSWGTSTVEKWVEMF